MEIDSILGAVIVIAGIAGLLFAVFVTRLCEKCPDSEIPSIRHINEQRQKLKSEQSPIIEKTPDGVLAGVLMTEKQKKQPNSSRSKIKDISGGVFFIGATISALMGWFVLISPLEAATNKNWKSSDWKDVLIIAIVAICIFGSSILQLWIVFYHEKIKKFIIKNTAVIRNYMPIKISIEIGKTKK